MEIISNLKNHFLIATELLDGTFFEGALVYICAHNEEQTFGLIVNQTMIEVDFNMVVKGMDNPDIPNPPLESPEHIYAGGPVEIEQGFVLHTPDYACEATVEVTEKIHLTATADVIEAIAKGIGPEHYILCVGFSGWSPHQLEKEISENDWMVAPASAEILFKTPPNERFDKAAEALGLNFVNFSGEVGDA